jgi:hypothetical protein
MAYDRSRLCGCDRSHCGAAQYTALLNENLLAAPCGKVTSSCRAVAMHLIGSSICAIQ